MDDTLPPGKLDAAFLQNLLDRYTARDNRVVVGPKVGEDATVIAFGETLLVAKTDPITFATDEIGWYAIHVNANDLATMGAIPRWLLATALLPAGKTRAEMVEDLFAQLQRACRSLNIVLCGGHTEVTAAVNHPVVVCQMLGETDREHLVTTAGARVGDVVLLTKGIAVEGTALIAREREEQLRGVFDAAFLERSRGFLHDPGISVLKEAQIIMQVTHPHAMHDPTEGGVATGLHELAQAAEVGLVIDKAALPIFDETAVLCQHFHLNPVGLIASGALLAVVTPVDAEPVCKALNRQGIPCRRIGMVVPKAQGIKLKQGEHLTDLPIFPQDEVAKLFG